MSQTAPPVAAPTPRMLLLLSVPALIVGVLSALILWTLDTVSDALESLIWQSAPNALGLGDNSRLWIFIVLTLVGAAVGLVVWKLPGHGGHDSATTELMSDPLPLGALPSLVLAVVLTLAGGVSLGPENPIVAINCALAIALVTRLWSAVPPTLVMAMAAAATVGALFGTPVAAALIFTGLVAAAPGKGELWDKLFLPLLAAGVGSITMNLLGVPSMSFQLPAYQPQWIDLVWGAAIAAAAVLLTLPIVYALPVVHRFFHRLRNPLVYLTLGGLTLGVLGAIGGQVTLFKGLNQTEEVLDGINTWPPLTLLGILVIKLLALLVSAASGFRGGRIFPAIFIGASVGVAVHNLLPNIPPALAVASGVLGVTLAISRDGWIALFVAVLITGELAVLPLMCVAVLPAWLLVSGAPKMVVEHPVVERWRQPQPR